MGNPISVAREAIMKETVQNQQTVDDNLNMMFELAEQKRKLFEADVVGNLAKKQIPVDSVLIHQQEIRASVSMSQNISAQIISSIGSFIKGNFLQGIETMISAGLKTVLGNFAGQRSQKQSYMIVLGENGAIMRIDYLIFAYEFKSEQLVKFAKNIVLIDYIVSAADTKDLDTNVINTLIQICFPALPIDKKIQMAKDIIKVIREEKQSESGGHSIMDQGRKNEKI